MRVNCDYSRRTISLLQTAE